MTIYQSSILTMALSRVVSEIFRRLRFSSDADNVRLTNACIIIIIIFNVEKYCYLEIPVKCQSRSLNVVQFDRLGMVSYSNFVHKTHRF